MDNYPNQQPNLNLPPIGGEVGSTEVNHELQPTSHPESITTPESLTSQTPKAPPSLFTAMPIDNSSVSRTTSSQDSQVTDMTTPIISDDSRDLIAKEWVLRAKRIVEQSRDDPHKQSHEFNKLKAEYVKQRYNMTIKVNNE